MITRSQNHLLQCYSPLLLIILWERADCICKHSACLSVNNTLSAEENTVDGRTIQRLDDVFTGELCYQYTLFYLI